MSTTTPVVLHETLPSAHARVKAVALVIGFALLTAVAAQIRIPLGFTPVPLTLQTAVALTAGAVLGARLGASSMLLYVALGLVFPFYSGGNQGWDYAIGATGGYLLGLVVASIIVGLLAQRGEDRHVLTSLPAVFFGSALVYAVGVPWLAHVAHLSAADAIVKGMAPFLIGDALKSIAIGLALPALWRLTR